MAKLITLGAAVSATAAAAQTGVSTQEIPFAPGFNAVAHIVFTGVTGTPTVKVQVSDDNVAWTDAATIGVVTRSHSLHEIVLKKFARLNVTAVGTAGTVDAYITE